MPVPLIPGQLACLCTPDARLLLEVVDIVVGDGDRQICWARPLALEHDDAHHDLRLAPDLLWPTDQLEPACDTEVLGLLGVLKDEVYVPDSERTARLVEFLRTIHRRDPSPVS